MKCPIRARSIGVWLNCDTLTCGYFSIVINNILLNDITFAWKFISIHSHGNLAKNLSVKKELFVKQIEKNSFSDSQDDQSITAMCDSVRTPKISGYFGLLIQFEHELTRVVIWSNSIDETYGYHRIRANQIMFFVDHFYLMHFFHS